MHSGFCHGPLKCNDNHGVLRHSYHPVCLRRVLRRRARNAKIWCAGRVEKGPKLRCQRFFSLLWRTLNDSLVGLIILSFCCTFFGFENPS